MSARWPSLAGRLTVLNQSSALSHFALTAGDALHLQRLILRVGV